MDKKQSLTLEECLLILDHIQGLIIIDKNGRVKYLSSDMKQRLKQFGNFSEDMDYMGRDIEEIHPMTKIRNALTCKEEGEIVFYMGAGAPNMARIKPLIKDKNVVGAIDYDLLLSTDWEAFMESTEQASTGGGLSLRENLLALMNKSIEKRKIKYNIDTIIGKSTAIERLKQNIRRAAYSDSQVLIRGETGCGKELIANAIHHLSRRANGPMIEVNCAAIPETLIESELFGYEGGSFTGARKEGSKGMFEMADKGTLFLDEIDQLPYHAQPKLLRVLQEKEVDRVGGTKISVDARVIAATNKDLKKMVEDGSFREDLYYRLNVLNVEAPPLREHKEDIPLLVEHHLQKLNKESERKKELDKAVYDLFDQYDWPGNVRQLLNSLERGFAMSGNEKITVKEFDELFLEVIKSSQEIDGKTLRAVREEAEREAIRKTLEFFQGNKSKAANQLGITRGNLYHKISKFGLE